MSWEPLTVNLGGGKCGSEEGVEEKNHYDNSKLSKKALKDLPVNPGEEVGMFYGLEVCHNYDIKLLENSNRKVVAKAKDSDQSESRKRKVAREEFDTSKDESSGAKKKTKRKKKKAKAESPNSVEENAPKDSEIGESSIDEDRFREVQQAWGNVLDSRLETSLYRRNFLNPTPIQAAALHPAILGRRNIVGAAPTGSGKTLAFLLPILNHILREDLASSAPPRAIIVTPTRELATQIYHECIKLAPGTCMTLVGGIALVKQARILATKRPPVIIGTPGRLWAMISCNEHEHLNDLSQIRYLVLDEADRMTQDHCFPQMLSIIDGINQANPSPESDDESEGSDDDEDDGRMASLPGIRGEAKVELLTDALLEQIQEQRASTCPDRLEAPDVSMGNHDDEEGEGKGVHRQTFIFSATLTLPFTSLNEKRKRPNKHGLEGGIADILHRTNAMGETKVIDLASSGGSSGAASEYGLRLPPGLSLEQVKCTQRHKDSHLYAYLMTTAQGTSGPCLIFCNSVAAVRRVGKTLETLRFSVRILHAQMQQRARFKAVESLGDAGKRSVVVCTDVAARGLDIPSVATVVHYDVARSVDGFVHRSGRTARGIGEGATGTSLSLVSPAEDKSHAKIVEAVKVKFARVALDGRLMADAQERANLASKIFVAAELEQKMNSRNKWFLDAAREADLEIDADLVEDESSMSRQDQLLLKEAARAKLKLRSLLSEPMTTQRFGKFLSTNSAAMQAEIKPLADKNATKKKSQGKIRKKSKR